MPVRTLYIDLAGAERSFALVDDAHVVGGVSVEDHRAEDKLMPAIDALLKDAGWNREDLTHVAAVTGPGGFMTIRVAVSLANAIAFALGIPSTGLHLSDVWRARVKQKDCVWLHSTKKTHAFVRGFGAFAKQWPEAVLQPIGDIAAAVPDGTAWMGELIPEHLAALTHTKRVTDAAPLADVLPLLLKSAAFAPGGKLEPWYGRGA